MKNNSLDDRVSLSITLTYLTFGITLLTLRENTPVWFISIIGVYFLFVVLLTAASKYVKSKEEQITEEFNKEFEDFLEEIRKINENEDSNL